MVGPWQVPVSDVAVTLSDYTSQTRRSDGDGRAHAARGARRAGVRPHGGRRSADQHRRRAISARSRRESLGELDGGVRRAGRGRGPVCDRASRRRGILSRARHHDSGRQGFAVDEDELDARTAHAQDGRAAVADRLGIRAGARRAPHADAAAADRSRRDVARADRSRRRPQPARRLGLAQVYGSLGREAPDCDDPQRLASFFAAIVELRAGGQVLAYHDRSDGGLFATVAEMAFAGRCGRRASSSAADAGSVASALFSEELGAVLQIRVERCASRASACSSATASLASRSVIGRVTNADRVIDSRRRQGRARRVAHRIAPRLVRDELPHGRAARQSASARASSSPPLLEPGDPGLHVRLTFDPQRGHRRAVHLPRARGRRSRSCASRASTVTSRWRRRSIAPASSRSTCT